MPSSCPASSGKSDGGVAMAVQTDGPDQPELIESKMRADKSGALVLLQTNYAVISQHPSEKGL
jgi:hypothetical protein